MAELDLTEAIGAGWNVVRDNLPVDWMNDKRVRDYAARWVTYAVSAAAPLIERQVCELVAREIEASKRDYQGAPYRSALEAAARIARGRS